MPSDDPNDQPLGMVPYIPMHNHMPDVACDRKCPCVQWDRHVARFGDPYERLTAFQGLIDHMVGMAADGVPAPRIPIPVGTCDQEGHYFVGNDPLCKRCGGHQARLAECGQSLDPNKHDFSFPGIGDYCCECGLSRMEIFQRWDRINAKIEASKPKGFDDD